MISRDLTSEFSFILSPNEKESNDLALHVFTNFSANSLQFHQFVANYGFLNQISNREFKFSDHIETDKQKLNAIVFKSVMRLYDQFPEQILLLLPRIISNSYFPLYFVDFTIQVFEKNENTALKILALESLMILIGQFGYEYENFYQKLYSIISQEFDLLDFNRTRNENSHKTSYLKNKYTVKFLGLIDTALKPNSLSKTIILSFLKVS